MLSKLKPLFVIGLLFGLLIANSVAALATQYPLYADKTTLIGNVEVTNVGTALSVTYNITAPGWGMTESHVHIGDSLSGFPLSNGNPIPGQFAYSAYHSPAVTTYTYGPIDVTGLGTPLLIAAHAKVNGPDSVNLAVNGSFEDGVYEGVYAEFGFAYLTGGQGIGYISNWTLFGTINWFDHTLFPYLLPSDGERFVNLKAIGEGPASLSQDIPTVAGQTYEVGFDLGSNPDVPGVKGVTVSADNTSVHFTSSNPWNVWTHNTFRFTATDASTTLTFLSDADVQWWGVTLDNVTVETINFGSAWAGNLAFPGKNWANCFKYTLSP
jgi:hypothetical protein